MFDEILTKAFDRLLSLANPGERVFALYLLGALLVAGLHWLAQRGHHPRYLKEGFVRYIFKPDNYTHKSARQDYFLFIANSFIYTGFLAGLLVAAPAITDTALQFVYDITGELPVQNDQGLTLSGSLVFTLTAFLCLDFAVFFSHYLMHKVPFLWQFHRVHHSAEVLNPFTLYRQHPVDLLLTGSLYLVLMGIVYAVFIYSTGVIPSALQVFGMNAFVFMYYLMGYNLRHSDIWVHYPRWMTLFLISPAQHQIHHSQDKKHFDKNMGLIFSVWDRMFGTLYVPSGYEKINYGIDQKKPNPFKGWTSLYISPFKDAWNVIGASHKMTRIGFFAALLLLIYLVLYAYVAYFQQTTSRSSVSLHTE